MGQSFFQLSDFLTSAAETAPNQACFRFPGGRTQSFQETETRAAKLANALMKEGIKRGDRIAILSVDKSEYLETIFACTMMGVTFVPLNNRFMAPELAILLSAAEPKAVFVSERYAGMAHELIAAVKCIRFVVDYDAGDSFIAYETLLSGGDTRRPDIRVNDDDCAAILFTSGSTGRPKGAMQSEKMLKSMFSYGVSNFELEWDGCGYAGSPLFHIAGYGFAFASLASRSGSYILPQFEPGAVLDAINTGEISHCIFMPTMITMLLDHPKCDQTSFDALKTVVYGGSPMSVGLLRRALDRFGCGFAQLFGAGTEAGTQSILTSRDHRRALEGESELLGSVGRAALGVRLKIVDPQGVEVPDGEVGEIITCSDQAMIGYIDRPEETARALRDGWLWAGDLGRRDANGYIYLAGRSKDMIIRGGENIYPVEIETVIASIPGVTHVSVIGEPSDHWGETVLACIVIADNFPGVEELQKVCKERLARYKMPARIEVLQTVPFSANGKILKPALREAGRDGRRDVYGAVVLATTEK